MDEPHTRWKHCQHHGCEDPAGYRAPVQRRANGRIDYGYFCKTHARERNLGWDYFRGMNRVDIEAFRHASFSWHRSTAHLGNSARQEQSLRQAARVWLEGAPEGARRRYPDTVHAALREVELVTMPDRITLKKQFRLLVKRHHPDAHPEQDRERQNDRLQRINAAIALLERYLPIPQKAV